MKFPERRELVFIFCINFVFSYDLDPDDGYDGRVLLPYDSYYMKDYKSSSVKTTWKPFHHSYKLKPKEPVNTLDPYEIAVATHDTHQHLTETTPIQSIRNNAIPMVAPINHRTPTISSSRLTELLQNMNQTSLQLLLDKLKENNYLPKTFTMNKLDNSLRTLAKVLVDLKKSQRLTKNRLYLTTTPPLDMDYPIKIETIKNEYDEDDGHDVKSISPPKQGEGKFNL